MTIDEIKTLKRELEDALRKAFSDFESRTTLAVKDVRLTRISTTRLGDHRSSSVLGDVIIELDGL